MINESKQNLDHLIEIIQSPDQNLTIFAGAGISAAPPTHAPLANEIKLYVFNALLFQTKSSKYFTDIFTFGYGELPQLIIAMPLEVMLQRILHILGEDCLKVFNVVGGRKPNCNHYFLIRCLLNGFLKSIITTNQDCYLENAYIALKRKGKDAGQIQFCVSAGKNFRIMPDKKQVFKLHGSIDKPQTIRATLHQVGLGLEPSKKQVLQSILNNNYVYFIGYSGADIDIRDVILEARNIKGLFWNVRTNDELFHIKELYKQFFENLDGRGVNIHFIVGDLNGILMSVAQRLNIDMVEEAPYKLAAYEAIEALADITRHNDDTKALALYEDAALLAEKGGNLRRAASSILEVADLQRAKGKYRDALRTNEYAMKIAQKLIPSEEGYRLLGEVAYRNSSSIMLSQYDEALLSARTMIENYKMLKNPSERWYGIAAGFRIIGQTYRDLGKYRKAIVYDRKAQKIFRKYGYLVSESWAWRSLIKTLLLLEPERAGPLFEEVERINVATLDRHDRGYAKLTRVELALALDNLQNVEGILDELESFSTADGDDYMLMRIRLYKAEVFRRMQKYDLALRNFIDSEQLAKKMDVIKVENHAKLGRLETLRLSNVTEVQQTQYQKIRNSFSKVGIVWGAVHSLIGEALFCLAQNRKGHFEALLWDAENIAKKEKLIFEEKQIDKIKAAPSLQELHALSFP